MNDDAFLRFPWQRYGAAVGLVAIATAFRFVFLSALGMQVPFATFYPAVMMSALLGGARAGWLAVALSLAVANFFWMEPAWAFAIRRPTDWQLMGLFVGNGLLVVWLADKAHRVHVSRLEAETAQRVTLESLVARRTAALTDELALRKAAEARLALLAAESSAVLDHAAIGMCMAEGTPDGRFLRNNDAMCAMLGYTQDELLGLTFSAITHPDDLAKNDERVDAILAGRISSYRIEKRHLHKHGHAVWADVSMALMRDEAGRPQAFVAALVDITERKAADKALRDSQKLLSDVLDGAPMPVFLKDLDGRFITINKSLESLVGMSREAIAGKTDRDLISGARAELYQDNDRQVVASGKPCVFEEPADMTDGHHIYLNSKFPLLDSAGRIYGVGAIAHEITEMRAAQLELQRTNALLTAINANSPNPIYAKDAQGRMLFANPAALAGIGRQADAIIGKTVADWHEASEEARAIMADDRRIMDANVSEVSEQTWIAHDTQIPRTFQVAKAPLRMPDGTIGGVVAVASDVTEHREQEEQIRLLMREVNHRARNMLAMVIAVARLTARSGRADFIESFEKRIQALAANQDELVKGDWKAVPLDELVMAQLAPFGTFRDTRISVAGEPVAVSAAASQTIALAIHELATNAVKYGALSNETGRVDIAWRVDDQPEGARRFAMSWVESGGPRVKPPSRRGFGSTVISGMVKTSLRCDPEILFAPTGLIWQIDCPAHTVLGNGPQTAAANGNARVVAPPVDSKRVLVVEDEGLIATEIAAALAGAGFIVVGPAGTVAEALALIADRGCDIALLDFNLGDENSEAIAAALTRAHTPYVLLTGYARDQLPAAMQDAIVLPKPFGPKQILAEITRCLAG